MKSKYSVNKDNQLLIKRTKKQKPLVVNGEFVINRNNQLVYWLNEPSGWRKVYGLPKKICFVGNWKLNSNYDLEFHLSQTKGQDKTDSLVLKGEIISSDRDSLVFELKSIDKRGLSHIRLLKLSGFWRTDEFNRIIFEVKKEISPDILIFATFWQLNQNQQVVYKYEKTELKTKTKIFNSILFTGFWQINREDILTYIFERSTKSHFDFRVQVETTNLYPKDGVIKYRLGIGIREDRLGKTKIISLYGVWKFSRKLGIIFQMDYGGGKFKAIEFAANVYLDKKDEIIFSLNSERKEPLGLSLVYSRKFLKKSASQAFLRLKKSQEESRLEAGIEIPF